MATTVTFNGVNYSVPAVNEEDWQSLSNYLIALAGAAPAGGPVSSNIRVSTSATTAVAVTDYAVLINVASPATVNLPTGVDKQIFVIADASGNASTNNITINRAGVNTILGGTSYVMDRDHQVIVLGFSGGNWYRLGETLPNSITAPVSTTLNGLVSFSSTDGKFAQDLGVGSANQVLVTDGTIPSFSLIGNDNIDPLAAIAYSKLNLTGNIINSDINSSAGIEYSKLNLTGSLVNADVNASAAIAYSKLNLANSIQNTDIAPAAAIAYSKLDLTGQLVNADVSATAAIAYSKLDLADSIVNADINSAAGIVYSKLDLAGSIVNADINASAAIERSKIANGTASHVVVNDGSGALSSVSVLPVSQGGTGLSALGSALQVLRVDSLGTSLEFASLAPGTGDVVGPSSSVTNGIVQFASTTGKALKDLGVGSANQVLLTDGTAPSFGSVTNDYIDASAGIAFSKLAALTSGNILVGSAGNVATSVSMTGDVTISNTGVTAISSGVIVDGDINALAGITLTKLAATTANRALATDASGFIVASTVTDTELGYLSGVTSGIQGQIDSKTGIADNETITGTWTFNNIITGDISGNAGTVTNGVYTNGAQTIAGVKTFNSTIVGDISGNAGTVTNGAYVNASNTFTLAQTITAASNQLVLSSGVNQLTLNSGTSAAARTYTVPDVGTTANFVMTAGTQTIAGAKTFSDDLTVGSTALFVDVSTGNVGIGTPSPLSAGKLQLTAAGDCSLYLEDSSQASGSKFWLLQQASTNFNLRAVTDAGTGGTVAISATRAGAVTLGASGSSVTHIANGRQLQLQSDSFTNIFCNSASGFDNNIQLAEAGTVRWTIGRDNSDSDAFIVTAGAFGTGTNAIRAETTGAVTLGPSGAVGLFHTINCTATTTGGVDMKTSGSLANSQGLLFRVIENGTGMASIGAFKNASESAANGYLTMRTVGAGVYYLWVDTTGDLRISTSTSDIGRVAGTVVGTQT